MFKRLAAPTGEIAETVAREDDAPDKIVRNAILIHSGPDGNEMTLNSSDGDITFDGARIESVIANHNSMIAKLALEYGGFDKMPVGAYPPILDQHADDSNDRIRGRLTGVLRFEKRSVPKIGDNVSCAIGEITFLGEDTVSKVRDGRIYHLSVGIDENSDTLGEVSTVIEPAAPGAMVLKKGPAKKKLKGANKMSVKRLEKLKALKGELKQLSAKGTQVTKLAKLAKRKSEVSGRFTKLMANKKMTPAEFKKVDVTRLAKMSKEDFESVMHVYDARESQIRTGQVGTTSASNFADIGTKHSEDAEVKRLKAGVKKNLAKAGMKFKASDDDDEKHLEADEKDDKKDLAEGDEEDASVGDVGESDSQDKADDEQQSEIMEMVEQNAAQIARVASLVDAIIDEMQEPESEDKADDSDDDKSDDEDDDKKDLEKSDDDKKTDKEKEGAE